MFRVYLELLLFFFFVVRCFLGLCRVDMGLVYDFYIMFFRVYVFCGREKQRSRKANKQREAEKRRSRKAEKQKSREAGKTKKQRSRKSGKANNQEKQKSKNPKQNPETDQNKITLIPKGCWAAFHHPIIKTFLKEQMGLYPLKCKWNHHVQRLRRLLLLDSILYTTCWHSVLR